MVVNACLWLGWRLNGSTDRDRWRRNAGCGDFWLIQDVLVRWRWAIGLWRCVPRWGTKVLLWLLAAVVAVVVVAAAAESEGGIGAQ